MIRFPNSRTKHGTFIIMDCGEKFGTIIVSHTDILMKFKLPLIKVKNIYIKRVFFFREGREKDKMSLVISG